jgi:hypothetical protein
MATINRNIIREWNTLVRRGNLEIVGDYSYPFRGGHRATFVRDPEGRAWVRRDRGMAAAIVAIIPSRFADAAGALEYDPCNDAAYTSASLGLADLALAVAECWQAEGQHKARAGGCDI